MQQAAEIEESITFQMEEGNLGDYKTGLRRRCQASLFCEMLILHFQGT